LEKERIEICAIGGFALLYRDIRQDRYTRDIDTVTRNYSKRVNDLIKAVSFDLANQIILEENWLNNDNVFEDDVLSVERLISAFWEKSDWKFQNIDLYVADIETLFRSKLIAAEDDNLTGRKQDMPDLMAILNKMGKYTKAECSEFY